VPRRLLVVVASLLAAGLAGAESASAALAPLPRGWPSPRVELGLTDQPGGAASLRAAAPLRFRYQYLAGGVNTGSGWSTWNPAGTFVTRYVRESRAAGVLPVFTYYMLLQSRPGGGDEAEADLRNLRTRATMRAYFRDLALFLRRAAAFRSTPIVLHVEPDLWGYVQQRARRNRAASIPAAVSSTGLRSLRGLPNNAAGLARAVVRLRDRLAPNVLLGYHVSVWGTKIDIALSDPPPGEIDRLAIRAATFRRSLGARFDLAFAEFDDRDSGFNEQVLRDRGASWWNAADFARHVRFLRGFAEAARTRVVLWQIPLGNTGLPDTWRRYRDNRVQWLLDDAPGYGHLRAYAAAGVIAFLFGGGADGTTTARSDGGYFFARARAYYRAGAAPAASPRGVP
jgi:hypothetical protein